MNRKMTDIENRRAYNRAYGAAVEDLSMSSPYGCHLPVTGPTPDDNGWLPIESAPRDGTEFQAWFDREDGHKGGWWEPRVRVNPNTDAVEIYGRVDYDCDGWDAYPGVWMLAWMRHPSAPPAPLGNGGARE